MLNIKYILIEQLVLNNVCQNLYFFSERILLLLLLAREERSSKAVLWIVFVVGGVF